MKHTLKAHMCRLAAHKVKVSNLLAPPKDFRSSEGCPATSKLFFWCQRRVIRGKCHYRARVNPIFLNRLSKTHFKMNCQSNRIRSKASDWNSSSPLQFRLQLTKQPVTNSQPLCSSQTTWTSTLPPQQWNWSRLTGSWARSTRQKDRPRSCALKKRNDKMLYWYAQLATNQEWNRSPGPSYSQAPAVVPTKPGVIQKTFQIARRSIRRASKILVRGHKAWKYVVKLKNKLTYWVNYCSSNYKRKQ